MCLYIYIYNYTYYIYTHIHICIVYMYLHIYISIFVCVSISIYIHMCIHIYIYGKSITTSVDLSAPSLESRFIREIISQWPQFRFERYWDLSIYIYSYIITLYIVADKELVLFGCDFHRGSLSLLQSCHHVPRCGLVS